MTLIQILLQLPGLVKSFLKTVTPNPPHHKWLILNDFIFYYSLPFEGETPQIYFTKEVSSNMSGKQLPCNSQGSGA